MTEPIHDEKYIVFKRDEFMYQITGLPVKAVFGPIEIQDAVVIRRQDYFASSALAGYAASIAIAAKLTDNEDHRKNLLRIADYFQQQSEAAADEGYKYPD